LGIFNQFFTHLLYDPFYTRLQIFIQISPTLTKLRHTKRDYLANFYRAMHFSAKRGIAIACRLSVRPSVCNVDGL